MIDLAAEMFLIKMDVSMVLLVALQICRGGPKIASRLTINDTYEFLLMFTNSSG